MKCSDIRLRPAVAAIISVRYITGESTQASQSRKKVESDSQSSKIGCQSDWLFRGAIFGRDEIYETTDIALRFKLRDNVKRKKYRLITFL